MTKLNTTNQYLEAGVAFLLFLLIQSSIFAQGCMPAKHMPLSLGTNDLSGLSYLNPGQFEVAFSYRFFHSERFFLGTDNVELSAGPRPRLNTNTVDLSARYAISKRFSTSLTIPFFHSKVSVVHQDGIRREGGPGIKLADLRINGNYWLLDPQIHTDGNIAIGLGLKIPTGDKATEGTFYTTSGPVVRPTDISQQPGDGGWGIILEGLWFKRYLGKLIAYASGFYLFNPRNTNGVEPPQSNPPNQFFISVSDQYNARLGVVVPIWQLGFSIGGRIDGIPVRDAIGDSDGFRRPGYVILIEPGLSWSTPKNSINFSLPFAVERNMKTSLLDQSRNVQTGGGLADLLVLVSYSRRF